MTTLANQATTFLALHRPGTPVILPTVWDAWSANLVQEAGFAALTVGSHPLAAAAGKSDREGMTLDEVLARVHEITSAVDIPVSVDLESGYGAKPAQLIEGLLQAGAIGLNIEDSVHSEGNRLRAPQEHADLIGELRSAADTSGIHVVLNARTDLFLRHDGDEADRIDRAIARLHLAAEAGADVLYPIGRHTPDTLHRLTTELPRPVNAVTTPTDAPKRLISTGIARISFGPFLQTHLADQTRQLLQPWS
ncbi:isocitrate lyase/phosphoenolpyruvate mutase family protein [Nocardia sp. ET3-3]|uniref:Isocitrate lyase/phosphoenolpyruvate mutase family protein n=1 Tax=Nocardia terrae TaxID=2675851 RepID=A0A7K1VA64_9NOCA|nr:isocitrate lyase/phosphoenolpyruvate mutase family protein [Nocardia terrae]MVU83312.1 isocitrate lyase/phosphoenolpyruvate mutase family protein [Nocardia terrae]